MGWLQFGLILTMIQSFVFSYGEARSPFLPADHPIVGTTGDVSPKRLQSIEYNGLMSFEGELSFSIFDGETKRSYWIPLNGSEDGLMVSHYDASSNAVTISIDEQSKRVALKDNAIIPLKPTTVRTKTVAKKPVFQKPPEVLREEEEARAFVSDVLEVGMMERERRRKETAERLRKLRLQAAERARNR